MTAKLKPELNTNSILITIGIMVSTWTLRTVSELREQQAILTYRVQALEKRVGVSKAHPLVTGSSTSLILGQLDSSLPSK